MPPNKRFNPTCAAIRVWYIMSPVGTRGLTWALGSVSKTDMLRIAESYFRKLLFETDSLQAVSTLASFWAPRARYREPLFGLALPEYNVTLCMSYSGEVGNGGHLQYFLNRGGWAARETLVALNSIGLTQAQGTLHQACSRFPECSVPDQPSDVESLLYCLPDDFGLSFHVLDATLLKERFDDVLLNYLQFHAEEVLLLERGLVS